MPAVGRPVALVSVSEEGVPPAPPLMTGAPALPTFAARAVPMPVPNPVKPPSGAAVAVIEPVPDTPKDAPEPTTSAPVVFVALASEENGKPVRFVAVPDDGVPKAPLLTRTDPAVPTLTPRAVRTPVPAPVSPVEIGSPVADVSVPLDGVPSAPPFTTKAPALPTLTPNAIPTAVPRPLMPLIGRAVPFVRFTADGVPSAGVTRVGDVARTTFPDPVVASSPSTPALLNSMLPFVPPVIPVVPTINPLPAGGRQEPPPAP